MRKGLLAMTLSAVLAFALAACGDDDDTASQSDGQSGQQAAEAPAAPAGDQAAAPAAPPAAAEQQAAAPATPAPAAPAGAGGDPVQKVNELNDYYRAVLVNADAVTDPHQFTDIALKLCADKSLCQVGIWTDIGDLPAALPVKVSQLKYQAFTYGRNRETKYEASLWNCDDYPDLEKEGCIPKPMR